MRLMISPKISYFLTPLIFVLAFQAVLAQESPSPSGANESNSRISATLDSLEVINKSEQRIRNSIQELSEVESPSDSQRKQLESLRERLNQLQRNFTEIASGISIAEVEEAEDKEFNWSEELQTLLEPLLNELKRATSQPRQIDRYRTLISEIQEEIAKTKSGLESVERLIAAASDKALLAELKEEQSRWNGILQQNETQLSIFEQKLQQRLDKRKSLFQTVGSLPDLFFRGRAQNLIIAILAVVVFWMILGWIRNFLGNKGPYHPDQRSFQARLFYVFYLFFRGIGSIIIFLLALFLLGDWVLLILGVLVLLGVLWTSKQLLPQFWTQATLILNMGAVREGERVEYKGLPWLVKTVNFYSHFTNPVLDSGTIRVPIKDLEDLRSRTFDEHEPWFPTKNGDWIILDDGVYGKVTWQSLEQVRITELGGAVKTYSVSSFLGNNPKNLSNGFRVRITFGVDYEHQAIVTTTIPTKLVEYLNARLEQEDYTDKYTLKVEFEAAGASSLDLAIIADFKGDLGSKYQVLTRRLQTLCVDACNEYGVTIPFAQLKVHMAENPT